ncbi:olfactory receptor 4B13-like [Eucyclogobius newberryi]|uniref:olfactory receptor 4B13-like n=1 Tax=Eucyclogobius newberryi TaxID=166745 RepID=UPI003B59E9B7
MSNSSDGVVLLLEGLTMDSSSLPVFLLLLLAYLFVVFSNVSISVLILLNRSLHQPVYLLYLNLSANDLLGNTTVIPRLLWDLLRPPSLRHIHLYGCVLQAFLTHLFSTTAHTILMIMAFDRYVAICSPLRYSAIMTAKALVRLTVWAWAVAFVFVAVLIGLTLRLTRCRFLVSGLYCSNASLFKLSCESTFINNVYGLFFTVVLFSSSLGSIVLTYAKITVVCLTKKNASLNRKALQTCSTHLFSYLLFICSGMLIIIFHRFPSLTQERKFITVMYHLLPSGLNPLIYGIQSKEIRRSFSVLVSKVSSVTRSYG